MPETHSIEKDFINRLTDIILENISNEQFGVSELASEVGMSRSNLLRKVKKLTNLSVSQFISQVRLKEAMELLKENSFTVSEVSYKVGFSSASYFIKCFRDLYGYPPGEANQHTQEENGVEPEIKPGQRKNRIIIASLVILFIVVTVLFTVIKPVAFVQRELEKSIAVLPFKNDSNDSTNVYIVNGLMESILNNLQKIEGLRVISRTSVEKYRNTGMTIPEIARELNVSYFVEGSGQKIGDEILLNIQLIEGPSDRHLWAEQYKRETSSIFTLQSEVAKNIVGKIEVIITPEEDERLSKVPTHNPVAYDNFLKGLDLLNRPSNEFVQQSIPYFQQAIQEDKNYARAYAAVAIAYYMLDNDQIEKKYTDSINYFADKAILLDAQLPQSLIAKGLFYMNNYEFEKAVPYFEKTLEYHPNNDLVLIFLIDLYVNHIPDSEKYLEYALRGIQLDISSYDSTTASYSYMHISNAFIQSGFVDEAEKYIEKSLEYLPDNLYSQYIKAYIIYVKNRDLQQIRISLTEILKKDSTRIDILQEVGKICYYQRDYESAYYYYKKFMDIRKAYDLDVYHVEDAKIAVVMAETGRKEEADELMDGFKELAENDQTIYKNINLAIYYSYSGEKEKAIEHLKLFSQQENYHYWTIVFIPIDPLVDNIKNLPEFQELFEIVNSHFWKNHERLKETLKGKNLI